MASQPMVRGKRLTLREVSGRYGIAHEAVRERYYRAKKRGKDMVKPSQKVNQTRRLNSQGLKSPGSWDGPPRSSATIRPHTSISPTASVPPLGRT